MTIGYSDRSSSDESMKPYRTSQETTRQDSPIQDTDSQEDEASPRQGPSVKSRIQMFQGNPNMPPPPVPNVDKRGRRSPKPFKSENEMSDEGAVHGYHRNQNNNWESSRQQPLDYSSSDTVDSDGDFGSRRDKSRKRPPTYKPPGKEMWCSTGISVWSLRLISYGRHF